MEKKKTLLKLFEYISVSRLDFASGRETIDYCSFSQGMHINRGFWMDLWSSVMILGRRD